MGDNSNSNEGNIDSAACFSVFLWIESVMVHGIAMMAAMSSSAVSQTKNNCHIYVCIYTCKSMGCYDKQHIYFLKTVKSKGGR